MAPLFGSLLTALSRRGGFSPVQTGKTRETFPPQLSLCFYCLCQNRAAVGKTNHFFACNQSVSEEKKKKRKSRRKENRGSSPREPRENSPQRPQRGRGGTARRKRGRRTWPINTRPCQSPRGHAPTPTARSTCLRRSLRSPRLQYRISATFHLVALACHRLDWCGAEIRQALQMRAAGVKISNAVGLLFCHSFQIN